jgi:hypothetical protein
MSDPHTDLVDRVRSLERAVAALEVRTAGLEAQVRGAVPAPLPTPARAPADAPTPGEATAAALGGQAASVLTLAGRTSVVLGGAFLLRALTESGRVSVVVGVSLGFAYALVWMTAAYREPAGRATSAFFHGLASALVALPLVFEAVARFTAYGTWTSALLLGLFAAFGLRVASRHHLPGLAAIVLLGTLADLGSLAIVTAEPVPFAVLAAILAPVTAVVAEPRGRSWLQWPVALVANLLVVALAARAAGHSPLAPPGQVLLAGCVYSAAYAWVIGHSLLVRNQPLRVFDVLQGISLLLIGYGGILTAASRLGPATGVTSGIAVLLTGAACYSLGLGLSSDRPRRQPAMHFFSSAAIVIVFVGATWLMGGVVLALWFAGLALVFSWLGARRLQPTLLLHGALYVAAAAATLGFAGALGRAWLLPLDSWPALDPLLWLVVGAASLGVLGPRLAAGDFGGDLTIVARTLHATVVTVVAATFILVTVGGWLVEPTAAGPLAALRSATLAVVAVAAAAAGRANRARAFGRLAYPLVALGAVKLLVEDFWRSGPVMIFVALAFFGVALIATTRLRR